MESGNKLHELEIGLAKLQSSEDNIKERVHSIETDNSKRDESLQNNIQETQKLKVIIDGLASTISEIQESVKSTNHLAFAVHEIASEMKAMRADVVSNAATVGKVVDRVKVLEDKPAKRWDGAVDKIILVIVGGVVAFFMAKIGM